MISSDHGVSLRGWLASLLRSVRAGPAGEYFELRQLHRSRRSFLQNQIRRLTQVAYLGGGTALCRVLGRYKMYVDATDVGLSSHIMLDGYWEMWVTEVLVSRLRRGMTVIDVGANIGYFTMIMADLVGARGSVHAFEPNLAIAGLLAKSAHVNGFRERVTLHPEPLGDEEGRRVMLHVPENYPGGATIVPAPDNLQEDTLLSMRRLDSYEALLDADIIKIDAEGAEQAIWRGMSGLLARNRPMTIFIEFMLTRYEDPGAFIDEMLEYGFALHFVSAGIPLRPISRKEILAFPDDEDLMLVLIR